MRIIWTEIYVYIYMHIIGKCYYDYYILKYNFPFKFTLFGGVSRRKKNESNYILEFLFPKLMFYPQWPHEDIPERLGWGDIFKS